MMDPLDILTNMDKVFPYYQAIFSADEHRVVGYEALARFDNNGEVVSLGSFFYDQTIPEEYRNEVQKSIIVQALEVAVESEEPYLLFFNQNPNLLMLDHGEELLSILRTYEEKGLSLSRIVMEITEHNFEGEIDHLQHLLLYYRTYGIKLAVDNIGKEGSNLDRIGLLQPDILKVDLHMLLKTSVPQSYRDVLYSLSMLAHKIGATLLYEDIESSFQLQYAWRNGGRYFQGFYLHKPERKRVEQGILKEKLKNQFEMFINHEKKKLRFLHELTNKIHRKVEDVLSKHKHYETYDELLAFMCEELDKMCFRMYVCDENGFQLSGNRLKREGEWIFQPEYLHKNWSWRPYFLENVMKMSLNQRGILSDLYSDIEVGETVRTFSFPLGQAQYLFIDLSYDYLYEKDALL
ncbi:EAL domain-containing protein [Priestia filamentosa]|uniref:EAL domain-containing protein n=1 Tax=Priestia filamentosa TaxID=1402861 RepID=UPI00234ADD23|nr:EAL domain-containing protein [Priestia filamentosa]WCM17816.1 EAL-associated domain-containing protein [Priestia filamentosa]